MRFLPFRASSLFLFALAAALLSACASSPKGGGKGKEELAVIESAYGAIWVRLHEETPVHKANFLRLAREGFYEGTTFHRVLQGFMIQGGDPNSKPGGDTTRIGAGETGERLHPEILDSLKHVRGAVAAARRNDRVNPDRLSNPTQFYVVQGREGAHHLDGEYTVFGQVVKGMEVVDRIAGVEVELGRGVRRGRPKTRVEIKAVRVERMPSRKVEEMRRKYVGDPEDPESEEAEEEGEDEGAG